MEILRGDFRKQNLSFGKSTLSIGNFDGVHRGHQELLNRVLYWADQLQVPATLLTFDPHPAQVVGLKEAPAVLTTMDQQARLFESMGFEYLVIQDFNESFSQLSDIDFLRQFLFPKFHPEGIVVGYDFAYGQSGKGTFDLLKATAKEFDCSIDKVEPLEWNGEIISSTRIRNLVEAGEVESASQCLGRPHSIEGQVIQGDQIGRTLGFPTANLGSITQLYPDSGVFFGRCSIGPQDFWAVTNIGVRPTLGLPPQQVVECHILDFDKDIYGQSLSFQFLEKLRDEKKFNNLEDLKNQISQDISQARKAID